MKHRNKRIGLNSDLLTQIRLSDTEWFKVTNIKDAKGAKGANGGK